MSEASRTVERALVELAWEHWTALGAPGWQLRAPHVRPIDSAVDPEALLLLTASLGDLDGRLRDEAMDWSIAHGRYLSKVRLKNLLRLGIGDLSAFSSFAATVNQHAHLGWPDAGARPRRFAPRQRTELVARGSVAAARVRARLVFGVSARAELFVLFASDERPSSASELAERAHYGRRNVVEALEAMRLAGLVSETAGPSARRFAFTDRRALAPILAPAPQRFIDWGRAFAGCWLALTTLRTFARASRSVRFVEAAKSAEWIERELERSGLAAPSPRPGGSDAWDLFEPWAVQLVHRLGARAEPGTPRPVAVRRRGGVYST